MPKDREIPRYPDVPKLSEEAIELLTKLCFPEDDPIQPVDLLFVFGSSRATNEIKISVEELLLAGVTKRVFVTGGCPHTKLSDAEVFNLPESSRILNVIDKEKFKDVSFFQEVESTNTLENVTEALKVFDFSTIKKIMFLFKYHDARRGYLILKTFLPEIEILQHTFPGNYLGENGEHIVVDKNTWFQTDFTRARVWGEFLRIKIYGGRGDFDISPVVDIVDKIDRITSNKI